MESNASFKLGDRVATKQGWVTRYRYPARVWGTIVRIERSTHGPIDSYTHQVELGYPIYDLERMWFDPTDLEPFIEQETTMPYAYKNASINGLLTAVQNSIDAFDHAGDVDPSEYLRLARELESLGRQLENLGNTYRAKEIGPLLQDIHTLKDKLDHARIALGVKSQEV